MKKKQRSLYLGLSQEIPATLCCFCKYGEYNGGGSLCDGGDGYYECSHPVENLSYVNKYEEDLTLGDDCIGFAAGIKMQLFINFTELIIGNQFDEWMYSKTDNGLEVTAGKEENGEPKYYKAEVLL